MPGHVDEVPSGRSVGTRFELDSDRCLGPCEHHQGVDATVKACWFRDDIQTWDGSQDPQGFSLESASYAH